MNVFTLCLSTILLLAANTVNSIFVSEPIGVELFVNKKEELSLVVPCTEYKLFRGRTHGRTRFVMEISTPKNPYKTGNTNTDRYSCKFRKVSDSRRFPAGTVEIVGAQTTNDMVYIKHSKKSPKFIVVAVIGTGNSEEVRPFLSILTKKAIYRSVTIFNDGDLYSSCYFKSPLELPERPMYLSIGVDYDAIVSDRYICEANQITKSLFDDSGIASTPRCVRPNSDPKFFAAMHANTDFLNLKKGRELVESVTLLVDSEESSFCVYSDDEEVAPNDEEVAPNDEEVAPNDEEEDTSDETNETVDTVNVDDLQGRNVVAKNMDNDDANDADHTNDAEIDVEVIPLPEACSDCNELLGQTALNSIVLPFLKATIEREAPRDGRNFKLSELMPARKSSANCNEKLRTVGIDQDSPFAPFLPCDVLDSILAMNNEPKLTVLSGMISDADSTTDNAHIRTLRSEAPLLAKSIFIHIVPDI